jgi:hypothetical protein
MTDAESGGSAAKPHLPHLDGYQSRRASAAPGWLLRVLPDDVRKYVPLNWRDWRRIKINSRLWVHFTGRVIFQRVLGGMTMGVLSYFFVCWLSDVAPYAALSEDPNTALKHPHWVEIANQRAARERELRRRIESSGSTSSVALEHATKAYSSQNASDRLG